MVSATTTGSLACETGAPEVVLNAAGLEITSDADGAIADAKGVFVGA